MRIRPAELAGRWYPADPAALSAAVDGYLPADLPPDLGPVLGGIVPHAGWIYSGAVAARTFAAVGEPAPRCFVLIGASHRVPVPTPALSPDDAWSTPLGPVPVDREIADQLLAELGDLLEVRSGPHVGGENSLEVQVPILAHLFPNSAIVPIAVPSAPIAVRLGRRVGDLLRLRRDRVVVIGSTDLTHYGTGRFGFAPGGTGFEGHRWSKEVNDRSFLDRILAFDARGALSDAAKKQNACGAGAAAAATEAALAMGATAARLLEHTTSFEARPEEALENPEPDQFVGYASVVFEGPG